MASSLTSSVARRRRSAWSVLTLIIVFVTAAAAAAMAVSALIGVGALLAAAWNQSGHLLTVAAEWGVRAAVSLLVAWAGVLAGSVLTFAQHKFIQRRLITHRITQGKVQV